MRVYVGGALGDIPVIVAGTLERAMIGTLNMYIRIAGGGEDDEYPEQWVAAFVGAEPHILRHTVQVTTASGDVHELYVEAFTVE